ncbi:MAG TPA: hypothetical protein VFN37_03985 [Candidatus Baltobacteraceae bacterium]|nr:hypothetical protein [Candidatus Baltobacteraceae bacterium]
MTATVEPRQLRMFRNAMAGFPAVWRFLEPRHGCLDAETTNPLETMILRISASAESEAILVTLLRATDRQFMAEAQFPLAAWQSAKDFLESIALEAFVVGVDERSGTWSGSMILRSTDLERRRDFSYIRSWLGTYDLH